MNKRNINDLKIKYEFVKKDFSEVRLLKAVEILIKSVERRKIQERSEKALREFIALTG